MRGEAINMQDRIERVVTLPASRERVWAAITDPAHISRWFGQIEGMSLSPGTVYRMIWEEGSCRMRVAVVEPPRRFAYQWYPGSGEDAAVPFNDLPLTTVEFTRFQKARD
jgi:uncharacterized protein YndB with AHSA1/START domain